MTLRLRLTLVATAVVAVVLGAASLTVYYVMRHDLFRQVDAQIRQQAAQVQNRPEVGFRGFDPESADYIAVVGASGKVAAGAPLPVDASIKATAAGREQSVYIRTTVIEGYHWQNGPSGVTNDVLGNSLEGIRDQ